MKTLLNSYKPDFQALIYPGRIGRTGIMARCGGIIMNQPAHGTSPKRMQQRLAEKV
jgi:hypothetical protein